MQEQKFDRATRAIGKLLGETNDSWWTFPKRLMLSVGAHPSPRSPFRGAPFRPDPRKPSDLVTLERAHHVRTSRASDIAKVRINPRQFLSTLTTDSRKEFLSILTPSQQQAFLRANTSRDFFNL